MKKFNQGGGFGGRRKPEGRGFGGGFGGRGGSRPPMFKATCAACGQECEVPFKPSGGREVFCSTCFGNQSRDGGERRPSSGRSFGRSEGRADFRDKKVFSATCSECGQRCEIPFRPSGDRPVYCNSCFKGSHGGGKEEGGGRQKEEQFGILNDKLDKILRDLSSLIPGDPIPAKIAAKKKAEKEAAKRPESKKDDKPKKTEKRPAAKKKK